MPTLYLKGTQKNVEVAGVAETIDCLGIDQSIVEVLWYGHYPAVKPERDMGTLFQCPYLWYGHSLSGFTAGCPSGCRDKKARPFVVTAIRRVPISLQLSVFLSTCNFG